MQRKNSKRESSIMKPAIPQLNPDIDFRRARFEKDFDAFIDAVDRIEQHFMGATECTDARYLGHHGHCYRLQCARRRLETVLEWLPDFSRAYPVFE